MHRRLVYIYLLNVPSFSSRNFNKIKRTSRLGRLLVLSLEILCMSCAEEYEFVVSFTHQYVYLSYTKNQSAIHLTCAQHLNKRLKKKCYNLNIEMFLSVQIFTERNDKISTF